MKRSRIAVALGVLALFALVGSVWADIRLSIPQDIQPSAYTSVAGPGPFLPGVINDGEWAAIPFYRPPECVPLDFNLLNWFDEDALACPLLVEGFAVWPGTEPVGFPSLTQVRGTGAVPVWFVSWPELQAAMADGELTIVELASLDSLRVGTASLYEEQLHFEPPHPVSHSTIAARGTLEDGGSFELLAIEIDLAYEVVRIVLK